MEFLENIEINLSEGKGCFSFKIRKLNLQNVLNLVFR